MEYFFKDFLPWLNDFLFALPKSYVNKRFLRGFSTPSQILACSVPYLKIINIFLNNDKRIL